MLFEGHSTEVGGNKGVPSFALVSPMLDNSQFEQLK